MDDQKKNNSKEGQSDGAPEGLGKESEGVSETEVAGDSEPEEGKSREPATSRKSSKKESEGEEKPAAAPKKAATRPAAEKPVPKKPPAKKPVRPARSRGPAYEDLEEDSLFDTLKERFGEGIVSGQSFLSQPIYTVEIDLLYDVMLHLRDDPDCLFDYLVDLTALDYLGEDKRFCLVYHLYSHPTGSLIRVKSRLERDEFAPSVTSIWTTADWLEREVYDMFGIEFSGHPDLKRILLPDDWHGFPLRKDYDIKLQDQSWIRKHLKIRKVPG